LTVKNRDKDQSAKGLAFSIHGSVERLKKLPVVRRAGRHFIFDEGGDGSDGSHGGDDGSNGSHDDDDGSDGSHDGFDGIHVSDDGGTPTN
jgi:hypothetical protein